MARRADADASRDLRLALLALRDGLIDPAQLLAGFETWTRDPDRPMAEILVAQGVLDEAARLRLEDLLAGRPEPRTGDPEPESTPGAAGHPGGEADVPRGDPGLSATV